MQDVKIRIEKRFKTMVPKGLTQKPIIFTAIGFLENIILVN